MPSWTFLLFFCICMLCLNVASACYFPDSWNGTYYSSRRGDLAINNTAFKDFNTTLTGPLDYTCFMKFGSTYVIRSDMFMLHNALHRAYFCLEVTELSSASVMYRHKTSMNAQAFFERMKVYPAVSSVALLDVCDVNAGSISWEMLVKQGSEDVAAIDCPDTIRGVYNYTLTMSSTTSCSLNGSSLDVCDNTTSPTINMTMCATEVAYSAGGFLQCLYTEDVGSYSYIIVLNMDPITDEATNYRFTCLVAHVDGDYTYVSQYPEMCHGSQTPTSAPAGGGTLVLLPSKLCPKGSASTKSTDVFTIVTLVIVCAHRVIALLL